MQAGRLRYVKAIAMCMTELARRTFVRFEIGGNHVHCSGGVYGNARPIS